MNNFFRFTFLFTAILNLGNFLHAIIRSPDGISYIVGIVISGLGFSIAMFMFIDATIDNFKNND